MMKKTGLNIVFYLVCLIVLLLFSAIFFNLKRLESFKEGVDDNTQNTTPNQPACSIKTANYVIIGDASMNVYLKAPLSSIFTTSSIHTLKADEKADTNILSHFALNMTYRPGPGLDYISKNNIKSQLYFFPTDSVSTTTNITNGMLCLSSSKNEKYAVLVDGMSKGLFVMIPNSTGGQKLYSLVLKKDEKGVVSIAMKDPMMKEPAVTDQSISSAAISVHYVCETIDGYKNIVL